MSLAAIMSEQMLEREQQQQQQQLASEQEQLALALKLSEEIHQNQAQPSSSSSSSSSSSAPHTVDSDLALAMQLQAEFDREEQMNATAQMAAARTDANSKVSIESAASQYRNRFEDEQEDPELTELSDMIDDEYEHYQSQYDAPVVARSFNYTRAHGGSAIHKHDPKVTSARNVSSIERTVLQSGDLTNTRNIGVSNRVYNSLATSMKRGAKRRVRRANKEDKAVADHVLDQATRLKVLNLINNGTLTSVGGVIATGKESNVYHALGAGERGHEQEVAVKIFAITNTVFRNRQKYMQGERRFRGKLSEAHSNKFIRVWAEKEMRNLCHLRRAGIACPQPIALREHILVMSFIGQKGAAAPQLRAIKASASKWTKLYVQTAVIMRRMFRDCKMVHSDLSAYNLLFNNGKVVVIDVSQAVAHDSENSALFLRSDCRSITTFFSKQGARVLPPRRLFEFVVCGEPSAANEAESDESSSSSNDDESSIVRGVSNESESDSEASVMLVAQDDEQANEQKYARRLARMEERAERSKERLQELLERHGVHNYDEKAASAEDAAFLTMHLPRTLHEVSQVHKASRGEVNFFDLL